MMAYGITSDCDQIKLYEPFLLPILSRKWFSSIKHKRQDQMSLTLTLMSVLERRIIEPSVFR